MEPTLADLIPYLSERGRVELDLAFALMRAAKAEARVAELEQPKE